MRIYLILLVLAAVTWITYESYLLLRDRTRAMGTTTLDRRSRLFNTIAMAAAISSPWILFLAPGLRFSLAEIPALTALGMILIVSGLVLRWWAVAALGEFFRTTVEVDRSQRVIRSGPYKYIRHPAYTGILLFFLGYGLAVQNWLSLAVAILLPTAALLYRIHIEEDVLAGQFGEEYHRYQSETKRLIPGVW